MELKLDIGTLDALIADLSDEKTIPYYRDVYEDIDIELIRNLLDFVLNRLHGHLICPEEVVDIYVHMTCAKCGHAPHDEQGFDELSQIGEFLKIRKSNWSETHHFNKTMREMRMKALPAF